MAHTLRWRPICPRLQRVQERARAHPMERFTSLAHLLDVEALRRAYRSLEARAACGVDGESKKSYGAELENRLQALHERLKAGNYRAQPGKRATIKKADGSDRLLSIWCVEDKIVQGAVVELMNSIFEVDFKALSYGFRPGRSAHQALQAVQTVLQKGRVNWVLDMDLKQCFDRIEHEALRQAVQRRIADRNVLRLIDKWLTVGVTTTAGKRTRQERGTPQGAPISPLLANIVLNEAMDELVTRWRREAARGEVYLVRYADDAVLMFEHLEDAQALQALLAESLAKYGLEMNSAKTRLIPFGRNPHDGDSGTFNFLGFTHIAGKDRQGHYLVLRKTMAARFARSLSKAREWCRAHVHKPVAWQWERLRRALQGHYAYYGIRGNYRALARYRQSVRDAWIRQLRKRSQTSVLGRIVALVDRRYKLPQPHIVHRDDWFAESPGYLLRRAGCGKAARPVL